MFEHPKRMLNIGEKNHTEVFPFCQYLIWSKVPDYRTITKVRSYEGLVDK